MLKPLVLGIDLGTSSVKVIAVDQQGSIVTSSSEPISISQPQNGYSEQNPDEWVQATKQAIQTLTDQLDDSQYQIEGMSFSGQMHGLVLLDKDNHPIRPAILWNDTRNTEQCDEIKAQFGDKLLGNPILEGFTLPKLLWVKAHEPQHFEKAETFILPKDYVRYALTGKVQMEKSDASGTLLYNSESEAWDKETSKYYELTHLLPELVNSTDVVGEVTETVAQELNLPTSTKVIAGGADNACGALGAGIIGEGDAMCSIGTSGVVLVCQKDYSDYQNNIHYFKHVTPDISYAMGVTLAAGFSLDWYKRNFYAEQSFEDITKDAESSSPGANGLVFTPYLMGERTPHGDAKIRGSFIGISGKQTRADFSRAVIEGITYSLYESLDYIRQFYPAIHTITSIGGGAKSDFWLQLQADVFNLEVKKLKHEEGPSMGAAILAAYGVGWFDSLKDCVETFIQYDTTFKPNTQKHETYERYFKVYQDVYRNTKQMTADLLSIQQNHGGYTDDK
ncbi:xylulokinase [Staphylococcus sp. HMSC10C03]|uniref:xylulokinase n=1 Tax=Staphylococcus sp. HMSC10C03 TaxID=1581078 RepID=UPI00164C373C|nr:xylulokinase [Staphylococcus sp. HMSC10C03]